MRRLDEPARPQYLQPFAQRRARHAELFRQTPLGRQRLSLLQHAVDDQPLDALGDHVRELPFVFLSGLLHRRPPLV